MTLPGGPANKLGNRYEMWWTVSECVRMLGGETDAIRIEAPSIEKAEFVVTVGSRRDLHQVKRSHPNGKWSMAALANDGLLQAIGDALANPNDRFVFVSSSDAPELRDLCEGANHAESVKEFERVFLAANTRKKPFESLLLRWSCDAQTAVERLKRIKVRTIDEHELEKSVRWSVQAFFLADPEKVASELRVIVQNSVHRTITRCDLVAELAKRGYAMRCLTTPENAGVAVKEATDQYLNGVRQRLIRQTLVSTAAAKTLLSRIGETATDSVLTGRAGSGKTACVIEIVDGLRAQGWPVLAFRLDRFLSAPSSTKLGQRLDLEESPVLVLAAAANAAQRPGVLIVDQLDSVSTLSGRSSGAFDLVEGLLQEMRGTRARAEIRTVVVCRAFDWKNDHRLRKLLPDSNAQVEATEFAIEEVRTILTDAGFEPTSFQERQLALLQLPQNLYLFLEASVDTSYTLDFGTQKTLFDRYWETKRQLVGDDTTPALDQWLDVIRTLCDAMTTNQTLAVTKEKLDHYSSDFIKRMTSEGVLSFDGRRYGFGHESFFDYCFARLFVSKSESLVSFLKGPEQHLFRRAQVRQVLVYLRDAQLHRYLRELAGLLLDKEIRAHIKDLVFALLAEVREPDEEEWEIWRRWITPERKAIEDGAPNPDKLSQVAWRRFFGSPSWFAWIDERGMVKGWLASGNDRLADMATNYLRIHQSVSPDRIAALLEPYADCGDAWPQRLRAVTSWSGRHTNRRFFDLVLRLVDNGTLDEARLPIATNSTFWHVFYGLDETCPEWFAEVLAHRLRRRVAVIRNAGDCLKSRALIGYGSFAAGMISKSAKDAPAAFVRHVLPVILEISDAASTDDDERPKRDAVWPVLIETEQPDGEQACLAGTAGALASLAREDAADLGDIIADLGRPDTHVANHLLLALYAGGAARHADEAARLLCDQPWRFECGFSDSPHWCAMETIRAVLPHCTAENRQKIETAILDYVPAYECTRYGYKNYGLAQFELLSAITPELRSTRAQARFGELERKFGTPPGGPRGIVAGWVKPPIEKDDAAKMTDDQWLGAIAKHNLDERPWHEDFKGGARDLAQVLEAQAKEEPERFARLGLRFPADANPVYLDRTLAALTGTPAAADLKLQICRKAFEEALEACGKSIADLIGNIEAPLPDDAVQMLQRLATEHEDPTREVWQDTQPLSVIDIRQIAESASGETSAKDAGDSKAYYNGDPHHHGTNTTRGRTARAIQELILTDPTCVDRFRPALERMVRDPSAAVRSCVAGTLRAVARHDPALGMSLFLKMDLSEDRLLVTDHVYGFIRDAIRDNFAEVEPVLMRMLRSPEPDVRKAGGCLASLATLHGQNSASLVDEALRGDACARLGVADVAAANIDDPQCRAWCEARLAALFDDGDADVRREAASCFRQVRHGTLETFEELIAKFCDSRAFQEDSSSVLHALKKTRGQLPGTTCDVCERFLDRFSDEARDIRTSRAGDAHDVTELVFRTYQQHQDDKWTTRSLGLIDRLCLERSHDAQRAFEQFER